MLGNQISAFRRIISLVICLLFVGCADDFYQKFYQKRADLIKGHIEAFHTNLKADRVEAAMHENEEIEAIASEMADAIRKRGQPHAAKQVDQEWMLLNTATEAAASNWLDLGKHFANKKKYDQALATYQRLINTNISDPERACRERAARAMEDLDSLSPPTSKPSGS